MEKSTFLSEAEKLNKLVKESVQLAEKLNQSIQQSDLTYGDKLDFYLATAPTWKTVEDLEPELAKLVNAIIKKLPDPLLNALEQVL